MRHICRLYLNFRRAIKLYLFFRLVLLLLFPRQVEPGWDNSCISYYEIWFEYKLKLCQFYTDLDTLYYSVSGKIWSLLCSILPFQYFENLLLQVSSCRDGGGRLAMLHRGTPDRGHFVMDKSLKILIFWTANDKVIVIIMVSKLISKENLKKTKY